MYNVCYLKIDNDFFCIFSIVNKRVNEYNWFCYWKLVDLDLKIIEYVD